MVGVVTWFLVVFTFSLAVAWAVRVGEACLQCASRRPSRRSLGTVGTCIVALVAVALIYRIHVVAQVDGHVVSLLVPDRSATLTSIMSAVTTIGDVVPSFMTAGLLSLLIYGQGRHTILAWTLPIIVLVQLVIQFAFSNVFHDVQLGDVYPAVVVGDAGTIPSGSVSRLLSVFLVAGLLWRAHNADQARRLTSIGAVLVLVQIVTRLYLGRHLMADMGAGLLLGVSLAIGASWLANVSQPREHEASRKTRASIQVNGV